MGSDTQPQPEEVREYLDTLLRSPAFAATPRGTQLLRYLAGRVLDGQGAQINEYAIGVDVFGKPSSFDPRLDSIVRTELSRLRQKLKAHYSGEGLRDRIEIGLPPRTYAPSFRRREPAPAVHTNVTPPHRRSWPLAIGLIGAAIALALLAVAIRPRKSQAARPANSIAVLPFVNLAPDHRDDYLADGITEELTNDLAQARELRVVARTSASLFKGKAADIRDIGRKLDAADVLEGSIERDGNRVRITAQLNRTSDGYHVWSRSYETPGANTAAVEREIARSVTGALDGRSPARDTSMTADSTSNPAAHDMYLRAYELALQEPEAYRQSLKLFKQAVHADPSYVNAYIGIARMHIALVHVTQEGPQQGFPAAREALQKALALNPSCGEARGLLANLRAIDEWKWPEAEQEFRRALDEGAQAPTRALYGSLLATHGRFAEAQAELRTAQDLDPLGSGPHFNQFMAFNLQRNYAEAKHVLNGMLEINPDQWDAHFMMGVLDFEQHQCQDASAQFEWCARKFSAPVTKVGLALAATCVGKRQEAVHDLEEARQPNEAGYTSPYQLALGYAAIGDKETAISELQKSADTREMQILYIRYDPLLDGVRKDSRFIALEKKVGLLE